MEKKRFIITGDMNGDVYRNRYYTDQKYNSFLKDTNCISIKNCNQNID